MIKQTINEIEINGQVYVPKGSEALISVSDNVVIVRTKSAGVFFGKLVESNLAQGWVKLASARRIWYWAGAASLSQLAIDGTLKPDDCKFPVPVPSITLLEVIEIIPCTEKAIISINGVKIWKQ